MRKIGLISLLVFGLVSLVAAQKQPHDLSIERGLDKSVRYVMLSDTVDAKYRFGKYKSYDFDSIMARQVTGFEHADKHWWNSNLTATQNVTHDARYKSSIVDHIGYWNLNAGHLPQGTIQFDSTAYVVVDSQIILKVKTIGGIYGNVGLNPSVKVDDVNNRITLNETAGDIRMIDLSRDNSQVDVVGINSSTGRLYLKANHGSPAKYYKAIITQSGTAAPSVTVLSNTFSQTMTWSRNTAGTYFLTNGGTEFTSGKTTVDMPPYNDSGPAGGAQWSTWTSTSRITFFTTALSGSTPADDKLGAGSANGTWVEIEVWQ